MAPLARRLQSERSIFEFHLDDVNRFRLLDAAEEVALGRCIEQGNEAARDAFICSNLRLVIACAKSYRGALARASSNLDYLDLVQEGYIGLMRAVEKWNWRLGYKFSSYAVWWIQNTVQKALHTQSFTIVLPEYVAIEQDTVLPVLKSMMATGIMPNPSEVAEKAGVSVGVAKRVMDYELIAATSLDRELQEDFSLLDAVATCEPGPEASLIQQSVKDRVREALDTLDGRLAHVLRLRFGIEDDHNRTSREVGEILGVTHQRVSQLERAALTVLRESHSEALSWCLGIELRQSAPSKPTEDRRKGRARISKRASGSGPKRTVVTSKALQAPNKAVAHRKPQHTAKWYVRKLQSIAERIDRCPDYTDLVTAHREGYGFKHEDLYDHFGSLHEALVVAGLK